MLLDSSGLTASGQLNRSETWLMTNFGTDGWPTVIAGVFTEDVGGVVGFLRLVFRARGERRTGAPAEMEDWRFLISWRPVQPRSAQLLQSGLSAPCTNGRGSVVNRRPR